MTASIRWVSNHQTLLEVHGLRKATAKLARTALLQEDSALCVEAYYAQKLPPGYDKRTFVYLNGVRIPAVWDTGAFRSTVSTRFAKLVREDPQASQALKERINCLPVSCEGIIAA